MKLRKLQTASLVSPVYGLFKTWNFVKIFFFIFPNYTSFRDAPLVQWMGYLGRKDDMEEKLKKKVKEPGADSRTFSCSEWVDFSCSRISCKRPKAARAPIRNPLSPITLPHLRGKVGGWGAHQKPAGLASISEKKKVRHPKRPPAKATL